MALELVNRPGRGRRRRRLDYTHGAVRRILLALIVSSAAAAAERPVDPTFLHRQLDEVAIGPSAESTESCRYRPLFGDGDPQAYLPKGVARFGELIVDPDGRCRELAPDSEEQIYYVLEGEGAVVYRGRPTPVRPGDFMYFAPGVKRFASNPSDTPLRLLLMSYHMPSDVEHGAPVKLPIANEEEAELQVVGNHPPSTQYRLLLGDVTSKRDLLATAQVVTSLFVMEFAPGGTNHPHHHLRDEEIYILLEGRGEMVAGGGADGVEGRHAAEPGDAYYFRPNATVGFYSDPAPDSPKAKILAVRSRFPGL